MIMECVEFMKMHYLLCNSEGICVTAIYVKALPHVAMKWVIFLRFCASGSIAAHRRLSQVYPLKSQQCGQSATHYGRFPFSPGMVITAMVIRNT